MRGLCNIVFSSVLFSAVCVPALAFAAEPHSWCVTGEPMVKNGSTDATTNQVIDYVCNKEGFSVCCDTGGRWGLSCVQAGADYAKQNNLSGGDYCGRYAWAQAPVESLSGLPMYEYDMPDYQYVPRDFNVVAVSGNISGTRDVEGAVAASGNINATHFNLNTLNGFATAAWAQGSLTLKHGTVHGTVFCPSISACSIASNVDFPHAPAHYGWSFIQNPVNFTSVANRLTSMSEALARYDATDATNSYGSITFKGTDPELNVFAIASSLLTNATSYTFDIPRESNVIVNVTGTSPVMKNAGFQGPYAAKKLLWNFVDATTLKMSSLSLPGTILAPKADAVFENGNIYGSIVVASASVGFEVYSSPYQVPSCTGGLCLDRTWSCSANTPVDDQGRAAVIASEAGFLEIEGGNYVAESVQRTSPTHRMWYSFRPADTHPNAKPLAVFFNGGPGSATSPMLFAFNTGPMTLDPQVTGSSKLVLNSNSWTKTANLLYIDAPATGFSYPVANDDGSRPSVGNDIDHDAAIFLRVVLRFLARHPALQDNRVIIVGESYGGVRATLMLQHIYDYASLTDPNASYQDSRLRQDLTDYFSSVFSTSTPGANDIATRFGHQVLIEPVVAGQEQDDDFTQGTEHAFPATTNCKAPTCFMSSPTAPRTCDPYNCDKDPNWSDDLISKAAANLMTVSVLSSALGVDAKTIEWMKASSRANSYGRDDGAIVSGGDMGSVFGTLGSEDNYLLTSNFAVLDGYSGASKWYSPGVGLRTATDYAKHLSNRVRTFVTVTKYDTVVWTPAIPYAMAYFANTKKTGFENFVSGINYSMTESTGLRRPGAMWVYYQSGDTREAIMPYAYNAGHTVPMRAPADLLSDVTEWYWRMSE